MASAPQSRRSAKEYSGFEKQWIAGEWKAGRGKGPLTNRNPYTGQVLVEIPHADVHDLDEAHVAAAAEQKAWGAALPADRSAVMRKAAQVMEARHDEIVSWLICRIKVVLSGLPSVVFQSQGGSLEERSTARSAESSEPYGAACSADASNGPGACSARTRLNAADGRGDDMVDKRILRVLVATDGSFEAKAALGTVVEFPWPAASHVKAVIARRTSMMGGELTFTSAALDAAYKRAAASAQGVLARRWPDAKVVTVDTRPIDAILTESRRFGADAIAVGFRGYGRFRRLLMGSVSRGVVRRARCAVLVVRRHGRKIRHIVIGLDGSANARRAVEFVARLEPPSHGRVTLVTVVETMSPPSIGRLPASIRATLAAEVRRRNSVRIKWAKRNLQSAAALLGRAGWPATTVLRTGAPLSELLAAADRCHAHVLAVGARGTGGVERLLLGSVAEGALDRCPLPVLLVR
jgi:nucleotide-binding universal stress UspA family protein